MDWRTVGWANEECKISKYFSVKEALFLHKWNRLANEKDGLTDHVKEQICKLAQTMDTVREFISAPIIVHRWWSSPLYNAEVGGAHASKHLCLGPWSAVDFHAMMPGCYDLEDICEKLRAILLPKLEEWGLRMEKNPGGGWVHLDNAPVVYTRYFKP